MLFVDLDNTLVDRAAAFAEFARDFAGGLGLDRAEAEWLIQVDNDGFAAREAVAAAIEERFCLSEDDQGRLLSTLRAGLVDRMRLDPEVPAALGRAREADWRLAIVTNGTVPQQTHKITALGLRPYVDAVVISEGVGVRKPDPAIFRYAAEAAGSTRLDDRRLRRSRHRRCSCRRNRQYLAPPRPHLASVRHTLSLASSGLLRRSCRPRPGDRRIAPRLLRAARSWIESQETQTSCGPTSTKPATNAASRSASRS